MRASSARLAEHRHERHQAVRTRDRDHLLAVAAPVHVRLCSEKLPPHVSVILDTEPSSKRSAWRPMQEPRRQNQFLGELRENESG